MTLGELKKLVQANGIDDNCQLLVRLEDRDHKGALTGGISYYPVDGVLENQKQIVFSVDLEEE